MQQMLFFHEGNPILSTYTQYQRHQTTTVKNTSNQNVHPPKTPKQVCTFLALMGYYRKFTRNFVKTTKPLTLLTHQDAKFEQTPAHRSTFLTLKE